MQRDPNPYTEKPYPEAALRHISTLQTLASRLALQLHPLARARAPSCPPLSGVTRGRTAQDDTIQRVTPE